MHTIHQMTPPHPPFFFPVLAQQMQFDVVDGGDELAASTDESGVEGAIRVQTASEEFTLSDAEVLMLKKTKKLDSELTHTRVQRDLRLDCWIAGLLDRIDLNVSQVKTHKCGYTDGIGPLCPRA